jgi:antirestriction protein
MMAKAKYRLKVKYEATAPGWLAEVTYKGRTVDSRWFDTEQSARDWFESEYAHFTHGPIGDE